MKHLKRLGLAAVAAMALMAFVGAGTASATTLTGVGGAVLKTGTTIHVVSSGTNTMTTSFLNIQCSTSKAAGSTSNETGTAITINVTERTTEGCNCEVVVLKTGTLSITWTSGNSGTVRSSGAEITASCSTIFGNVHCIYATNNTDMGTLVGSATTGATATLNTSADIPRLSTSALCNEKGTWDANYKIDNPDTLNVTS
jgi:hypothetical protein